MNPRIENLRGYILRKEHHVLRRTPARLGLDNLNIGFAAAGMPPVRRSAEMLAALMRAEQPVILPGEKIVFTRTVTEVPEIFTPQEWDGIKASHYIHERGTVCNISPDYETTIRLGLDARKAEIASRLADDSLAALRKFYFEERRFDAPTLLSALEDDFRGAPELQRLLRREAPKMGQDDDYADSIGRDLLASFARALEGRRNERGGIYRAGTGTAMYYVFHAAGLGATPDGRSAGEMIPANYSPSLFIDQRGPVSVIKSFTKPRLEDVVNGGPLTLEFDQSVFNNEESVRKLGMLVKTYIALGGHQLQLNTVSREKLLDAKVHPERHRNLIVRVWGWSGYFVELDECYQNHVINRIEFGL